MQSTKSYFEQLKKDLKESPGYVSLAGILFLIVSVISFFIIQNPSGGIYHLKNAYTETYLNNGFTLFNFKGMVLPEGLGGVFKSIGLIGSLFGFMSIILFMQAKKSGMGISVIGNICLCFSMFAAELNLNVLLFVFGITPVSIYSMKKGKDEDLNDEGQFRYSNKSGLTLSFVFVVSFIVMLFLQYIFVGDVLFKGDGYPQKVRILNGLDLVNNATYIVAGFGLMRRNVRYLFGFFITDFLNLLIFTPISPQDGSNLPMTIFYVVLVLNKPLHFGYGKTKVPMIDDGKIRIG